MSHVNSMCQSYFGLTEAPFSIAPDPRYLFMSQRHQEALATLLYGLNSDGGFVLLTGDVGAGKTTLCRCLLEQIPEACDVAYIFNPRLTVVELLSTICDEFGIAYPAGGTSIKTFVDLINAYLLESHGRGRRAVLIIDEAQNLSAAVLEQMRLLTNLETDQRKLLQIILLGQPELAAMLERPELRQLEQRIVARYHLGPLTRAEVRSYVWHRLEVSGARRQLFPGALMGKVYKLSRGVPRLINTLCDRALLGTCVQGKEHVDRATLRQAAREVFPRQAGRRHPFLLAAAGMLFIAGCALIGAALYQDALRKPDRLAAPSFAESARSAAAMLPVVQVKASEDSGLPATLEWPADVPLSRSGALADAALLRAWGLAHREGETLCRQAEDAGLSCQADRGGLDALRHLNRPAILHMRDGRGRDFQAMLAGLDERSATFAIGAERRTVVLGALAAQWSGRYTVLWRAPQGLPRAIAPGEHGPTVEWLSRQLALIQGTESGAGTAPVFDDKLVRRVKQFQLDQGLVPDGVAGPQTLTRLVGVADQTAPRLLRVRGDN